jgi:hypothetical protein
VAENQAIDAAKQEAPSASGAANPEQGRTADVPVIRAAPARPSAGGLAKSAVEDEWSRVTEDEATRRLGRRPLRVQGIPVTGYLVSRNGGDAVRVTQTLPDGAELALVQQRVETERDAAARFADRRRAAAMPAPTPAPALREDVRLATEGMTVERDGYRVTAQAGVGRDSLAALLRQVR